MKNAILTGLLMACVGLSHADTAVKCISPALPVNDAAIQKFAESAALQSFTYNFETLPTELNALENCYTKTGWQSFSLALQRSGNIDTAKQLKLQATAQRRGPIRTLEKETATNTWRVLIPIKVVYRNNEQSMTQNLDVKLLVNIENNKVGIEQITASPSLPADHQQANTASFNALEKREDKTLSQETAISHPESGVSQRDTSDTEKMSTQRAANPSSDEHTQTVTQSGPSVPRDETLTQTQARSVPNTPEKQTPNLSEKSQAETSQKLNINAKDLIKDPISEPEPEPETTQPDSIADE